MEINIDKNKIQSILMMGVVAVLLILGMYSYYINSDYKQEQEIQMLANKYTQLNILIAREEAEIRDRELELSILRTDRNTNVRRAEQLSQEIKKGIENINK